MLRRIVRPLVVLTLVAVAGLSPSRADERMSIPGTPVSLLLPEEFVPSKSGTGFDALREFGAAVHAIVMPNAGDSEKRFEELKQQPGRFAELLARSGIVSGTDGEVVRVEEREYFLVNVEMEIGPNVTGRSWAAITGPKPLIMIQFTQFDLPNVDPLFDKERVIEALATVEFAGPISFDEQLATTGLTLTPQPPFEFNSVQAGSLVMLSTTEDQLDIRDKLFILVMLPPPGTDERALPDILDAYGIGSGAFTVTETSEVTFAGKPGIRRERLGTIDEHEFTVVEYVARLGRGPVIFTARGPSEEFKANLATIESIAASVAERVKQPGN